MESLEQAAITYYSKEKFVGDSHLEEDRIKDSFFAGAKWQEREMYTSTEVQEILIRFKSEVISNHQNNVGNVNPFKWFKQFEKDAN